MKLKVDTSKAMADITARAKKANLGVNRALKISAFEMQDLIKSMITRKQSSGKTYGNHVASAPGYAPNGDSGFLAISTTTTGRVTKGAVFVIVGAAYAKALEFGSRRRNLRPRPFVSQARQKLGFKIYNRIKKAVDVAT